jgi:hypothetical protein
MPTGEIVSGCALCHVHHHQLLGEHEMQTGYGPALLLGVLIGGAILLDDVITPGRKGPPPRVTMFHHDKGELGSEALGASDDHNVWVIKTGDASAHEIHKEVKIHLGTEASDSSQQEELMISVSVDTDDEPAADLAAAIGAAIDSARAEGRQPTKAEIEAAVSQVAGNAKSIDVEVLSGGE